MKRKRRSRFWRGGERKGLYILDIPSNGTTNKQQPEPIFITIAEAAAMMDCSYSKAQQAVADCNRRARELGLFVIQGKTNRRMFLEYIGQTRATFFEGEGGKRI